MTELLDFIIIISNASNAHKHVAAVLKNVDGFLRGLPESKYIQIKITEQMHAPFQVIDGKSVITVIDNPLIKDGRIASLYAIDNSLAKELREGYSSLELGKTIVATAANSSISH